MFFLFILVLIIVVILWFVFLSIILGPTEEKNKEQTKNVINNFLNEYDITPSKTFSSSDKKNYLYYDDNKKKILAILKKVNSTSEKLDLIKQEQEKRFVDSSEFSEFDYTYSKKLINSNELIQCELFEDDSSITKTSRGSQLGGALIGGALAGGVGAVIGGLSGTKTSTGATKRIELRLTVNDTLDPLVIIRFLDESSPIKKDSKKYENTINEALQWQNLFTVLLSRNEEKSV